MYASFTPYMALVGFVRIPSQGKPVLAQEQLSHRSNASVVTFVPAERRLPPQLDMKMEGAYVYLDFSARMAQALLIFAPLVKFAARKV